MACAEIVTFEYTDADLSFHHVTKTKLQSLLETTWSSAMENGFFKYTLQDLESRILNGKQQFIVQLNRKRFEERRKPQPIQHLTEPFDPDKFNFTKIKKEEIMAKVRRDELEALCLINVSPLEFGHSLLVPNVPALQNQVLNKEAIRLGIESILLCADPNIRVAYNSLCAHASVNHLHLHIWWLKHELFVQKMSAKHLNSNCYEMSEHEVGGYAWEISSIGSLESTVNQISRVVNLFMERDVAHNLFITKGEPFKASPGNRTDETDTAENGNLPLDSVIRVLLWPRKSVLELKTANDYNIAVAELAGQVPVKGFETFRNISEDDILQAFRECRLEKRDYESLKKGVMEIVMER